ncbi:EamA family transporter [Acinetobacter sp. ANC 4558]|uniref:DMT family transporter n=1 Tax=Acinetobacter sp. ANC 4558 TaxID=1977876 RepID=UPI000A352007|nr:DMT family transporter [Acinetobacter sp. ANC 4558]OTG86797.1 EamA family transporter [Acinetobacter sp. ANC 4558]
MVSGNKNIHIAIILPLIAVFIWSLNIAITRYVTEFISPASISFYRWFVAFIVLTPFLLPRVWKHRNLVKPHLGQLAVLAAFGMVLYQGLSYSAAHYTSATNMGIINAFIPVFTIFVSIFILKEWPNRFAVLGSIISFSGLLLVITQGSFLNLLQSANFIGDGLMIIAVFFYAFYGVFLRKWQLQIPLFVSLYIQISFAVLYHIPFILWLGLDPITAENGWSVLYAGIFPSLIAPLVWMLAIQNLGPNRTSIFMNLTPIFTAILAYFWLGEYWTIFHTLGTIIAIIGVMLAQKKN